MDSIKKSKTFQNISSYSSCTRRPKPPVRNHLYQTARTTHCYSIHHGFSLTVKEPMCQRTWTGYTYTNFRVDVKFDLIVEAQGGICQSRTKTEWENILQQHYQKLMLDVEYSCENQK